MRYKIKFIFFIAINVLITSCSLKTIKIKQAEEVQPFLKNSEELLLKNEFFVINYNKKHRLANWVKYKLKKEDLNGPGTSREFMYRSV